MKRLALGLIMLLLFLGCVPYQDLILRPSLDLKWTPATFGFDFEAIEIPVDGDRYVSIWHVFSENPKGILVVIPGSDANKGRYVEALPLFIPEGYDIILIDYEGYGESPGPKGLQPIIDDTRVVLEYALTQHETVIGFGVSIGTPALARAAADLDLTGCIFEGTLILADEPRLWLIDNGLFLPPIIAGANIWTTLQTPPDYNIEWFMKFVTEPKLFIHSVDDEVTPYIGGQWIYAVAPEPKELWTVHGGHGKMARLETDLYKQTILEWIESISN